MCRISARSIQPSLHRVSLRGDTRIAGIFKAYKAYRWWSDIQGISSYYIHAILKHFDVLKKWQETRRCLLVCLVSAVFAAVRPSRVSSKYSFLLFIKSMTYDWYSDDISERSTTWHRGVGYTSWQVQYGTRWKILWTADDLHTIKGSTSIFLLILIGQIGFE